MMSGATFCQSRGDVCQWRWKDRANKVYTCGEKTVWDLIETIEGVYHIPHVLRPHRSAAARHPGTVVVWVPPWRPEVRTIKDASSASLHVEKLKECKKKRKVSRGGSALNIYEHVYTGDTHPRIHTTTFPPEFFSKKTKSKRGRSRAGETIEEMYHNYRLATGSVPYLPHPSRWIVVSSGPPPRIIAVSIPSFRCEIQPPPERDSSWLFGIEISLSL